MGQCDVLPVGDHTHCSYGYSSDSNNTALLFQSEMPPSGPDTSSLSATASTSFTDHHPGHLIANEDSSASPTSPSPTSPLHPSLSAPSTHRTPATNGESKYLGKPMKQ